MCVKPKNLNVCICNRLVICKINNRNEILTLLLTHSDSTIHEHKMLIDFWDVCYKDFTELVFYICSKANVFKCKLMS
jgi:hypothetical protein